MQSPCEGFLPHSIDVCKTAHIFAQVRNARAEAMVKITNAGALKKQIFSRNTDCVEVNKLGV